MASDAPRRILVTGATGFVGGHLLAAIQVALPTADVFATKFEMSDPAAIEATVRSIRPDGCVHLAAVSAVPAAQADPELAWRINLHGTLSLARSLIAEAPGCALVFVSTGEAYGRSFIAGTPLDEAAALNPMNTYGATKAAADLALGAMAGERLRVIRLRPFNHTGPGQSPAFVVASFARQLARIEAGLQPPTIQVGALDPKRDFLDVRDVCDAYALCLKHAATLPPGQVLNIASGVPRQIGEVLSDLLRASGLVVHIETDTNRLRTSEISSATGNAHAARALLGWEPTRPWDRTIADVLSDWRRRVAEQPDLQPAGE